MKKEKAVKPNPQRNTYLYNNMSITVHNYEYSITKVNTQNTQNMNI